MKIGFITDITDIELNNYNSLENKDFKEIKNIFFTAKKAKINWEISPEVKSWGIKSFGFSILPGSYIDVNWDGQEDGHPIGEDEDGDMQFNDVDCSGDFQIIINEDWAVEFRIDLFQTPNDFCPTSVAVDYDNKKLLILF